MFQSDFIRIIIISLTFLISACSENEILIPANSTDQLSGKLNITGSSTIAPLAAELAKSFEIQNPQLRINVQTGGSSRGLADIRQGTSNIGMISRKLRENENDVNGHLIAKDGVSIIVHKSNPIDALSTDQIKAIYLGKITLIKQKVAPHWRYFCIILN